MEKLVQRIRGIFSREEVVQQTNRQTDVAKKRQIPTTYEGLAGYMAAGIYETFQRNLKITEGKNERLAKLLHQSTSTTMKGQFYSLREIPGYNLIHAIELEDGRVLHETGVIIEKNSIPAEQVLAFIPTGREDKRE